MSKVVIGGKEINTIAPGTLMIGGKPITFTKDVLGIKRQEHEVIASYGSIMLISDPHFEVNTTFCVYVQGDNRKLFKNFGNLIWEYDETPPGVELAAPMGVIAHKGDYPYGFFKANDGNLWADTWNSETNSSFWQNHGKPDGVELETAMGAVTVDDRPYIYIKCSDGNLWCYWYSGTEWHWQNHGTPEGVGIEAFMGALTVDQRPYVYVKGSDGNLWSRWWNGSGFYWDIHGTPPSSGIESFMGSMTVNQRPYIFIKGTDQCLWHFWWTGSQWSWDGFGLPEAGVSLDVSMGAVASIKGTDQRPRVFFKGGDGNLWMMAWDGKTWYWHNHGRPANDVQLDISFDSVGDNKGQHFTFFKGSDKNLWVRGFANEQWFWVKIGKALGAINLGPKVSESELVELA